MMGLQVCAFILELVMFLKMITVSPENKKKLSLVHLPHSQNKNVYNMFILETLSA
jgi:hypothetical protein